MLKGRGFSLVISDWNMGGMSGLICSASLGACARPGSSRFLFATSERSWGHQTSAKVDGADGFITKPFGIETLKAKIEAVLTR